MGVAHRIDRPVSGLVVLAKTSKALSRLNELSRRRFLRGMLNGGVVTLSLPLLNCFLNDNGTALASGGWSGEKIL